MSSRNRLMSEALLASYRTALQGASGLMLAVSGGPDSQALLHLTSHLRAKLGLNRLVAVGVDHGLRDAAAEELEVAANLARRQNVAFYRLKIATQPEGNKLAWARDARYHALHALRRRLRIPLLATGHTADDQLEHMLISLCRGRGTRSLAGMPSRRGDLIRPLLAVSRGAIEEYNLREGISAATDPSNADIARDRGWLRREVIPRLVERAPHVASHAARVTRWLTEDERYLDQLAQKALVALRAPDQSLCAPSLLQAPDALRVRMVRQWLESWGSAMGQKAYGRISLALAAHVKSGEARQVGLSKGRIFFRQQRLYCAPASIDPALETSEHSLSPDAAPVVIPALGKCVSVVSSADIRSLLSSWLTTARDSVAFDADRLHLGLWVRAWQKGDVLEPWGHPGHVKIGDLFTNLKVPEPLRAHWPVVLHGSEIVWVAGLRRGRAAAITQATRNAWVVRFGSMDALRPGLMSFNEASMRGPQ